MSRYPIFLKGELILVTINQGGLGQNGGPYMFSGGGDFGDPGGDGCDAAGNARLGR